MIRFGPVRAFWKGFRAYMILTCISIGICAYCLIPNPARNFQYKAWWYSLDKKYLADNDPTQESQFRAPLSIVLRLNPWQYTGQYLKFLINLHFLWMSQVPDQRVKNVISMCEAKNFMLILYSKLIFQLRLSKMFQSNERNFSMPIKRLFWIVERSIWNEQTIYS
jgi:hypothetical protein